MNKLMNKDHGVYVIDSFQYIDNDCINPNIKNKKYSKRCVV